MNIEKSIPKTGPSLLGDWFESSNCDSVQMKILFENIPITDPQLGITDLTLIPETLIHQITLFAYVRFSKIWPINGY